MRDDLLGRRQALEDVLVDRAIADAVDERLDDLEVDVRLEQRHPDLAQRDLDRLSVRRASPRIWRKTSWRRSLRESNMAVRGRACGALCKRTLRRTAQTVILAALQAPVKAAAGRLLANCGDSGAQSESQRRRTAAQTTDSLWPSFSFFVFR